MWYVRSRLHKLRHVLLQHIRLRRILLRHILLRHILLRHILLRHTPHLQGLLPALRLVLEFDDGADGALHTVGDHHDAPGCFQRVHEDLLGDAA